MTPSPELDLDITLQTLNYATRQIASELNRERLIQAALDTLADFGRTKQLALIAWREDEGRAELVGFYDNGAVAFPAKMLDLQASIVSELFISGAPRQFYPGECALNAIEPFKGGNYGLLCFPLVGPHERRLGLAVLRTPSEEAHSPSELQALTVITTLISAAMENSRLFELATIDGLTGLYVRRYFELRLQEELARVRRHGGSVGLLITDIDHFKSFNDTYGHQQGDIVLAHLAKVLRSSVRIDLDIPCRYGGEEFVTILPGADITGALVLAERFRSNTENYPFPGQDKPLKVTVSGGVAVTDSKGLITAEELLKHADSMLYKAKSSGRNRMFAWGREG